MKKLSKALILFCIGGGLYVLIELLARGRSHWTMALLGGLCFLLIGTINEHIPWDMGLLWQALIGAGIVTALELFTGLIVNVRLGWGVWDYSNMPLNLWGQICLPYFLLWIPVSIGAIWLDDWLRWRIFGEEEPHYTLF